MLQQEQLPDGLQPAQQPCPGDGLGKRATRERHQSRRPQHQQLIKGSEAEGQAEVTIAVKTLAHSPQHRLPEQPYRGITDQRVWAQREVTQKQQTRRRQQQQRKAQGRLRSLAIETMTLDWLHSL